jgi:hypothetical protein
MRTHTRSAIVALAATALTAGGLAFGSSPASAQEEGPPYPDPVAGNFTGDTREEVFSYWAGPSPDTLVSFSKSGTSVTTTKTPFTVSGYYRPIAANVDGDAYDEIVWYAAGPAQDYLWNFTSSSAATSSPLTINGYYDPVAGDFTGDGTDDVFWYGSGSDPDYLWDYAASGSYTSTAQPVGGLYVPVAGSFGVDDTDDVFFYNVEVSGPDNLWDFVRGTTNHVNRPYPVNGYYSPFALDAWGDGFGGGDLFWYGYGPDPDYMWDFAEGRLATTLPDPVSGYYYPVVTADLFGDGSDDVLWFNDVAFGGTRTINVWDHHVQGTTLVRDRYLLGESAWTAVGTASATTPVAGTATVGRR